MCKERVAPQSCLKELQVCEAFSPAGNAPTIINHAFNAFVTVGTNRICGIKYVHQCFVCSRLRIKTPLTSCLEYARLGDNLAANYFSFTELCVAEQNCASLKSCTRYSFWSRYATLKSTNVFLLCSVIRLEFYRKNQVSTRKKQLSGMGSTGSISQQI